jgi:dTDP-glucose 4,6-dehydratase
MSKKNIIITGGAGFIGSHVVRRFVQNHPDLHIINLDVLTYAGNLENLKDVEKAANYEFVRIDITDKTAVEALFTSRTIHGVIHLAAESHVDRSITNPIDFVMTNVVGTVVLLNAYKAHADTSAGLFYHVSTDEVYGTLGDDGKFTEETPYDPNSPYSASKASSDHFVRAYHETYKLPMVISNCSNNYGSHQFPEKLIPLMIHNITNNKPFTEKGRTFAIGCGLRIMRAPLKPFISTEKTAKRITSEAITNGRTLIWFTSFVRSWTANWVVPKVSLPN